MPGSNRSTARLPIGADKARSLLFYSMFGWVMLATGCVQPMGPGFHFAARQTEIRTIADAPDKLHVRVVDHLENAGNRKIQSLDVRLPEGSNFGTQDLRVAIEGKDIFLDHSSPIDPRMVSAAFDPAWEEKQPREIVVEWDMVPKPSARGSVAVSADAFYIADTTSMPVWQTPPGIFSMGATNPEGEILSVLTPPEFRILAAGQPLKHQKTLSGNMAIHSFRIRPERDYLPYVIAGRYQEQVVREREGAVTFWTFRPIDPQSAKTAAARLSVSMRAMADYFGPASKGKRTVRIVEAPVDLPSEFSAADNLHDSGGIEGNRAPGGTSFPEGALLNSSGISQGVANEAVLELAEYELARTWFGWRVRPTPEAQILMGRGVGLFGLVIAAEARGADERGRMISSLLERYDQARAIAPDKRLMEPPFGYSRAERISTGYRAALFLVELEDLCGRDSMRVAFRDIIHSRAGAETSYEDLRSAVELASKRDLAEQFRAWLIRPGIPNEFRNRYSRP